MAHKFADLGVDLIIRSGAHILQGIEAYRNSLIAYNLGDFIFDKQLDTSPSKDIYLKSHYTDIFRVYFSKDKIVYSNFIPAIIRVLNFL